MRDIKGVDPDARGGRDKLGVEGRESIIRIYYMRKNLFSITGKKNKIKVLIPVYLLLKNNINNSPGDETCRQET